MCDRRLSTGVAVAANLLASFWNGRRARQNIGPTPHRPPNMRAVVVALIDLGRSARMRYHAQALSAHGVDVDLVGFEGTPLPKAITDDPKITVHRLPVSIMRHGVPALSYAPI